MPRTALATCAHHWLIASPDASDGGLVGAACLRCGVERTFRSAFTGETYDSYGRATYGLRMNGTRMPGRYEEISE